MPHIKHFARASALLPERKRLLLLILAPSLASSSAVWAQIGDGSPAPATAPATTLPNSSTGKPAGAERVTGASATAAKSTPIVVISELRAWGPAGPEDSFVELLNTTDQPLNMEGWSLRYRGPRNATVDVPLGKGKTIPAHGHLLLVGRRYSLKSSAAGDIVLAQPITGGVQLRDSKGKSIDVVGPRSAVAEFREGEGVAELAFDPRAPGTTPGTTKTPRPTGTRAVPQFSCVRKMVLGRPRDTDDNSLDFALVSVSGLVSGTSVRLGAPGPESSRSPILRPKRLEQQPGSIPVGIGTLEATEAARPVILVRDKEVERDTQASGTHKGYGTLTLSCRIVNTTPNAISQLRFQVNGITSGSAQASVADVRLLRARDTPGFPKPPAMGAATAPKAASLDEDLGQTPVLSAVLDEPPTQINGGGLNSQATVKFAGQGLLPGHDAVVQFLLGVEQKGRYRVTLNSDLIDLTFDGHTEKGLDSDFGDGNDGGNTQSRIAQANIGTGSGASSTRGTTSGGGAPSPLRASIIIEGNTEDDDGSATLTVAPPQRSSPLNISSSSIEGANNSLLLLFDAPLGENDGDDPPRYEVEVNGVAVTTEGVTYGADHRSVKILLTAGTVHPGDAVVIKWSNLRDANGLLSTGQVGPVRAR